MVGSAILSSHCQGKGVVSTSPPTANCEARGASDRSDLPQYHPILVVRDDVDALSKNGLQAAPHVQPRSEELSGFYGIVLSSLKLFRQFCRGTDWQGGSCSPPTVPRHPSNSSPYYMGVIRRTAKSRETGKGSRHLTSNMDMAD